MGIQDIKKGELKEKYQEEGASICDIAGYYNVGHSTIRRRMIKYGIQRRSPSEAAYLRKSRWRKYAINEYFFKTWTPKSAWMFGWVHGDGNIASLRQFPRRLTFDLARTDREVLEKFKVVLDSEQPIDDYERWDKKYQKYYQKSRVFFNSSEIANDLKEMSFYDAPEHYFNHLLRGFFEADGCVYWKKDTRSPKGGNICSSIAQNDKGLLDFIRFELQDIDIVKGGSIHQCGNTYQLSFGKFDTISLYHYLYDNCKNIFLKRKKKTFERLIGRERLIERELAEGRKRDKKCA